VERAAGVQGWLCGEGSGGRAGSVEREAEVGGLVLYREQQEWRADPVEKEAGVGG
jgi:hypothetical protein